MQRSTYIRAGVAAVLAFTTAGGCYSGRGGEGIAGTAGDGATDGAGTAASDGAAEGGEDGSGGDDGPETLCPTPTPGASPIRRLTAWEYDNTIRDLLGDDRRPSTIAGFPEEGGSGFDNNADVVSVTRLMANKYMLAAEDVATVAVEDLGTLTGCDPVADESGCVRSFITDFGRRAWRRPLTDEEANAMVALYDDARDASDVAGSLELLLGAFLQSPHFLYRVELGVPGESGEPAVRLDDWEMASRLSYFLWGSMPDAELFAAAEAGELNTAAQVEAQARRMLDAPQTRAMVGHFYEQWFGYKKLASVDKDPAVFPDWSPELAQRQHAEAEAFVEHVTFDDDGRLGTMLTAPYTFVDAELAALYGIDGVEGSGLTQVEATDREMAGILSLGGIMSTYSKSNQTNPIARGIFVREHLLCQIPPPPPDDVDLELPPIDPNATTRERFEQHRDNPACAGCHMLFDPIGFGFENYDALGRWRTTENDLSIDASGELFSTDVDREFNGVAELGAALAESEAVAACTTRHWFRFAYGRTESAELDECNLDTLDAAFADSGYDLRELLVTLTQTDAFMYRTAFATEGGE